MRFLFLTIVVALSATASCSRLPENLFNGVDQRFFYANDANGKLHLVDSKETGPEVRYTPEKDVKFYLYTRKNSNVPEQITYGDVDGLKKSNFNARNPVKIVIHGWNNDFSSPINGELATAFLNVLDVNVFCVDWNKGANGILYPAASGNVPGTGAFVGTFVDWLVANGATKKSMHIVGHSLGAHVSAFAARNTKSGRIPYITGFDPAAPLWGRGSERLVAADGDYVEIIHTNAGNLGIVDAVGHNDFYPNGGSGQPGCGVIDVGCSHGRSYEFFADSLDHKKFVAKQCTNYDELNKGKCADLSRIHMGGSLPKAAVGVFYLETNAKVPYYQG